MTSSNEKNDEKVTMGDHVRDTHRNTPITGQVVTGDIVSGEVSKNEPKQGDDK